jgi:hypothetical protein
MSYLQPLQNIEFHDADVIALQFTFEPNTLTLVFGCEEQEFKVVFSDISDLIFDCHHAINDLEINAATFTDEDGNYAAEYIFLLGVALPSAALTFKFKAFEFDV